MSNSLFLDPLNLALQLLDEAKLVVRDLVLLLELVILLLEPCNCDLQQLCLPFVLQCTVVVELMLLLLKVILLLPLLDLISQVVFLFLFVLQLVAEFLHLALQFLDLEVFNLAI